VFPIQVAPLRERMDDIAALANHFVELASRELKCARPRLTAAAITQLQNYDWPGNVRELRNVIERAVILETSPEIEAPSLPDFHLEGRLRKTEAITVSGNQSLDEVMAEFERQVIVTTLEQNRYNISKTADQLKISRHALRYRMQRLSISAGTDEDNPPPGNPSA